MLIERTFPIITQAERDHMQLALANWAGFWFGSGEVIPRYFYSLRGQMHCNYAIEGLRVTYDLQEPAKTI